MKAVNTGPAYVRKASAIVFSLRYQNLQQNSILRIEVSSSAWIFRIELDGNAQPTLVPEPGPCAVPAAVLHIQSTSPRAALGVRALPVHTKRAPACPVWLSPRPRGSRGRSAAHRRRRLGVFLMIPIALAFHGVANTNGRIGQSHRGRILEWPISTKTTLH